MVRAFEYPCIRISWRHVALFVGAAIALSVELGAQAIPFKILTVRSGLLSNYVTCFTQDRDGYLWIGTSDGISIYDGTNWRYVTTEQGLAHPHVAAIVERRALPAAMYIGGPGGLQIREGISMRRIPVGDTRLSNSITSLAEDDRGVLWIGTLEGLYALEHGKATRMRSPDLPRDVSRLAETRDGYLWILSSSGLYRFHQRNRTVLPVDSLQGRYDGANFLCADARRNVYVCARDSAILQFRDGGFIARHRFPSAQPTAIVIDNHGTFWILSNDGLFHCAGSEFSTAGLIRYTVENGLHANALNTGFFDRENNIWLGTEGKGVARLMDNHILLFKDLSLTGKGTCDTRGHLWMSSEEGLWEFWEEAGVGWQRHLHPMEKNWPGKFPFHLEADARGNLWASFYNGGIAEFELTRRNGSGTSLRMKRTVIPAPGCPPASSFVFAIDNRARLWYPIAGGGLAICDTKGKLRLIASITGRPRFPEDISAMHLDEAGNLWTGGEAGRLATIALEDTVVRQVTAIGPAEGIPDARIRAIHIDHEGKLWIGTVMEGLCIVSQGKVSRFGKKAGLPDNKIWSFAEGPDLRMWIGTQTGLTSVTSLWNRVFLPHRDLTDSPVYSCGVRPDGVVWAATRYGLSLYNQPLESADTVRPNIFITSFLANGHERDFLHPFELGSGENNCQISFTSVVLRNAQAVRFEYMLEGIDRTWREATAERTISLPALTPGAYSFLVRAVKGNGVRSARPAMIRFVIARPFWRSAWFITISLAALALVLSAALQLRFRRLLAIERIRAHIAADLHDDIGSGLTRIALLSEVLNKQLHAAFKGGDTPENPSPGSATPGGEGPNAAPPGGARPMREAAERIGGISRELVENMSDVVWSIDPKNDSLVKLVQRLKIHAVEVCEACEIQLDFRAPELRRDQRTGSDLTRGLLLVGKEAFNNIAKHSRCSQARFALRERGSGIEMTITDNGVGFDETTLSRVNGLNNMRARVAKMGGTIELNTAPGRGTSIAVLVPFRAKTVRSSS